MYILHILDELKPSGAEVMLHTAASFWRGKSLKSDILSTGSIPGEYASTLENSGYHIYNIPFVSSFAFLLNVHNFLKKRHYDVIHIHPERANFWYALLAYATGHRAITRTIHNVFPFQKSLKMERYIQRWIMRRVLGVQMISISYSVKDTEWKTFSNPSILIPNWFDNTAFKPPSREERSLAKKSLGIPEEVTIFTSLGGCWSYKNHSAIIKAVASLPKNKSVVYLHVGQEADGYPERKLAETSGVPNRFSFLGFAPDIVPILYASDVYVMPSLYEGFGVAAIEAMGVGLPAILSDVTGLRDFREICKDIYWVAPTSESIAEAMLHFLEMSDSARREIGLNLSINIHTHFEIENGAGAYARLYRTMKAK